MNHRICYERERKVPCKIIKIDKESGAVFVESIKAEDNDINHVWISPDDLVGNFIINDQNTQNIQSRHDTEPSEEIGQISPICVSSIQETIDLTEDDDEDERNPGLFTPDTASPRYASIDSLPRTYVPHMQTEVTPDNEISIAKIVADACNSVSPVSGLSSNTYNKGMEYGNQNLYEDKFPNTVQNKPWLPERRQSDLFRYANQNLLTRDASSIVARATLDSPLRIQAISDRFGMMGSPSPVLSERGVMVSELGLLKQHSMALDILMAAKDLGTILAILHYIKLLQQRGVSMGPATAKLVSDAEMTSRALMEDGFFRHMTTPVWSGGKGYNASHAGLLLCRLSTILGSGLGRMDSPMINSAKLLGLGLNRLEISDSLPYIQQLEDDILMKTLKFKRQFATVY